MGGGVLIQAWFEKADSNSKPDSNPLLDFRLDPDPHIMNKKNYFLALLVFKTNLGFMKRIVLVTSLFLEPECGPEGTVSCRGCHNRKAGGLRHRSDCSRSGEAVGKFARFYNMNYYHRFALGRDLLVLVRF